MKKKSKFLIVLLTAIITFGTLFATVGKPTYMKHLPPFGHCEKSETNTIEQK